MSLKTSKGQMEGKEGVIGTSLDLYYYKILTFVTRKANTLFRQYLAVSMERNLPKHYGLKWALLDPYVYLKISESEAKS